MSTPADSTMSGGNADTTAVDNSRLQQPTDAVPMENIAQPAEQKESDSAAPDDATGPGQSTAPAADSDQPESASPKAKDKDDAPAPPPPAKERQDSDMAIGAAQDDIKAVTSGGPDSGPVCNITLLLASGGRHPYKIDAKYLSRRNVAVPEETESGQPDPFSISIYTLKELILREWRTDWEAKPASPSSIRLIHFGKLLDDKEQLKSKYHACPQPNADD